MRKCALAAIAAFAALMTWPLVAAADVTPTTPTASNDSAKGSGSTTAFPFGGDPAGPAPAQVSFSSLANFNDTDPQGWMKATIGANTYAGVVTCMQVDGNFAQIAGYIDKAQGSATFNDTPAVAWYIEMTDNGSSGDQMLFSMGPQPLNFNICVPETFSGPMTQADVIVNDG